MLKGADVANLQNVPDGQVTLQRGADKLAGGSQLNPDSKCTRSKEVSTKQVENLPNLPALSPTCFRNISKMPNESKKWGSKCSSWEVDPRPEA